MRRPLVLLCALAGLSGCSLVIGDLQECTEQTDCGAGRACDRGFCVRVPEGCRGNATAGFQAQYGETDGGNVIPIGAALSLTDPEGNPSDIDLKELDALVLALDEINARGVGNGRRFALHVCDYASNAEANMDEIATHLTDRVGAKALIVANSGGVLRAAETTLSRDVLLISPNATSTEIEGLNNPDGGTRLVWRTAPSDAIQGEVINDLLLGESSFDAGIASSARVGIAYVSDPYGQGLGSIVLGGLTGSSKEVTSVPYDRGADISSLVSNLNTFDPDVSVLIGFPDDVSRILTSAEATANLSRASGHQWFFTDAAKDPGLASSAVDGMMGTAPAKGAGLAYAAFKNSFQARYGINADTYAFVEHDYDLMYALSLGIAYAVGPNGTEVLTGSRIAEGLALLSAGTQIVVGPSTFTNARTAVEQGTSVNVEGASGSLQFDPALGQAPAKIEVWRFEGSSIVPVTQLEPQ